MDSNPKGRVVFLIRLKEGAVESFLGAYEGIRHVVASGVPGHIVDQVCQSPDDPHEWLITSEWESIRLLHRLGKDRRTPGDRGAAA